MFSHQADHIYGALLGMIYGDAFGLPGELWPRERIQERFGTITRFLDGPADNIVACYFTRGHYTDDSAQALVILRAILREKKVPQACVLAHDLLAWVESMNGFEINLLGPSSKASLLAYRNGEDPSAVLKTALTNGAAMRIAPVGTFFHHDQKDRLVRTVAQISRVTHGTDVAITGAAMIAQAVASATDGRSWEEMAQDVMDVVPLAMQEGERTWAASLRARFALALEKIAQNPTEEEMSLWVYEVLGTGTMTSESVPAALALAWFAKDPVRCAHMCANLGGDTDTIGAMAVAICGAKGGRAAIPSRIERRLLRINAIDLESFVPEILALRGHLERA